MHDEKRQRRFQFSLRKLLLWMAVIAAWLSVMRLANASAVVAVPTIVWLAVIVAVRLNWGTRRGYLVAAAGTGFCLSVLFAATYWLVARQCRPAPDPCGTMIVGVCVGVTAAAFIGLCVSVVAELSIRFVDLIDGLIQTKTPDEDSGGKNL